MQSFKIRWREGGLAYEMAHYQFLQFAGEQGWQPAMNAYLCEDRIEICFDLAGITQADIDLRVSPTRLILRGNRPSPEPAGQKPCARQILAMEIDYGPFARDLHLPVEIVPQAVTMERREGLLWIQLPLRTP